MEKINKPEWIIVHHVGGTMLNSKADTSSVTLVEVNRYHKDKWNFQSLLGYYIGYHYFIEKDGSVMQGRLVSEEGAHTLGMNRNSIGICLAGNFDVTDPTIEQKRALGRLILKLMENNCIHWSRIVPHRVFAPKSCYGERLPATWALSQVQNELRLKIGILTQIVMTYSQILAILQRKKALGGRDRDCEGFIN